MYCRYTAVMLMICSEHHRLYCRTYTKPLFRQNGE